MSETKGRDTSYDGATIRLFTQASKETKRRYRYLALLYPLGQIGMYVLAPFFVGRVLSQLVVHGGHPGRHLLYFAISAFLGLVCNRYGFANLLRYQAEGMALVQAKAFDKLLSRSTGFHNNNVGGKLVSDALDYPSAFSQLTSAYFVNLIPFVIILVAGAILVSAQSLLLGLIVTGMSLYAVVSAMWESKHRAPIRARRLRVGKDVTAQLADSIVNVQTVKTFAREDDELATHHRLSNELLDLRLRDWSSAALLGNQRMAVLFAIQLAFLFAVITSIRHNPALLGTSIFAVSFVATLTARLFETNTMLRQIEEALLMASPMTKIMLEDSEIQDKPDAGKLTVSKGAISFDNVNFDYHEDTGGQNVFEGLTGLVAQPKPTPETETKQSLILVQRNRLKFFKIWRLCNKAGLTLQIASGEKVGLVGPSGGGKSTLTRLLLRFEDIDSGQISIDGQDISEVTQESLRSQISYVPQEPLMFHRTVHENIAYGKPHASNKAIARAAASAHADEFINKLTNGYETVVGERGVKLSGGQRQRVAIARAILKDAPILVLDEATSALDSESEVLIQEALWKLMEGRTAVVIAHRLSTIQKMDRIIVLDNGQIVEQGSHKELLEQNGLYAKLWKHQSGGFIEE